MLNMILAVLILTSTRVPWLVALAVTSGVLRTSGMRETSAVPSNDERSAMRFAWGDYDQDGFMDLYVYLPDASVPDRLMHNDGNGSFEDATYGSGLPQFEGSRCAVWGDFDRDNDMDLAVIDDQGVLGLWENRDRGTFYATSKLRLGVSTTGWCRMELEDYDRDGYYDICARGESWNTTYHNVMHMHFEEVPTQIQTASSETYSVTLASGTPCTSAIVDTGVPGVCLQASSQASGGMLYPVSNNLFIGPSGEVGIGTIAPSASLDIRGSVRIADGTQALNRVLTSDQTGLASWQPQSAGALPGAVAYFNLPACPNGWTELGAAGGRYLVALPAGGMLDGSVGTALTDGENRQVGQHNHDRSDPGHSHTIMGASHQHSYVMYGGAQQATTVQSTFGFWTHAVNASTAASTIPVVLNSSSINLTIANAGSVAGTNAPYIQLRVCKKN